MIYYINVIITSYMLQLVSQVLFFLREIKNTPKFEITY